MVKPHLKHYRNAEGEAVFTRRQPGLEILRCAQDNIRYSIQVFL